MKYFNLKEFKCQCGTCDGGEMSAELLAKLDKAREIAGIPFVVTSGFRCIPHNAAVGGKPNSAHTRGLAVDIGFATSSQAMAILRSFVAVGFNRIGYNSKRKFFHVDVDTSLPQNVFFDY